MNWYQKKIKLDSKIRGFHVITHEIITKIPEISNYNIGTLHLFLLHTSASLSINENADFDVRRDMETYFNEYVPEYNNNFKHTAEGSDDMPAHIKSSLIGNSLLIPINMGKLEMGTWQGIYFCEHRNISSRRYLIATINGEK